MNPVRYRWDQYGGGVQNCAPKPWHPATPGNLRRVERAFISPGEIVRIEYDNGQMVRFKRKPWTASFRDAIIRSARHGG